MRILFVTPYVPSRIRVRPFHFIKALAASHEIVLVALLCDEYERELAAEVAPYCASLELVPLPKWQAFASCLQALPTSLPLRVAYYRSAAFAERIRRVMREQRIDVVHGELIKTVPALQQIARQEHVPVVYDAVDCVTSYLRQQHQKARNPLEKAFVWTELYKMRRYEPRALATFEQVLITAERDRACLLDLGVPAERVQVVPNGVDTAYFTPPIGPRAEDTLVFCAKMDYYPNAQSMLVFCQEVMPLIWKRRPQARLSIVGNNPPASVRLLAADERITVTGYVADIRPYLSSAAVALAPLHVAAGMQNKVMEALAMAAPLVATPAACGALSVEHGVHLLQAEDAQQTAEAVLTLLEEPQLAYRLGQAGRGYVEERCSWTSVITLLQRIYQATRIAAKRHEQPTRAIRLARAEEVL